MHEQTKENAQVNLISAGLGAPIRIISSVSGINAVLREERCERKGAVPITFARFIAPPELSTSDLIRAKAWSVPAEAERCVR